MANSTPRPLAELVWPEERYARSTNIGLDNSDPEGVPNYKFTSKSLRLLEEVLEACQGNRRDRAWSVVGPYGSGKSIFGLFLLQLLTGESSPWLRRCLAQLQLTSPELAQQIETASRGYVPVVLQGSGIPLDLALCKALLKSASDSDQDDSWSTGKFSSSLRRAVQSLESGVADSNLVIEHFDQAAQLAQMSGRQGLVVIIDEFGKFLESASWQSGLPDLQTAQYLAELASGANNPRILFFVLLHQGFQHYASSLSRQQWLEWAKIQGRFRQVDFNEEAENLYGLVAATIVRMDDSALAESAVNEWARKVWDQVRRLPAFNSEVDSEIWPDLLTRVYPLHPMAIYALPRLSSRMGQNERSLFTFLASNDPLGFKSFLRKTSQSKKRLPSLTLDYLFDYFVSGSRSTLLPPDVQRRVSEIEAALDRLGDRPSTEVRLLKVLGLLSILRAGPSLPASEEVVAAALGADTKRAKTEVAQAIESLIARKIIVYRRFAEEYRIWEGSDFDFDGTLAHAREEIEGEFQLSRVLEEELSPRPVLARRHSYETGTNRLFSVAFLSGEEALNVDEESLARLTDESGADGMLLYTLPANLQELKEIETRAEQLTEPRVIICVPEEPLGLKNLALDLAALRKIRADFPELQDDPVAMKELVARIEFAEELLREKLESATEPAPEGPRWYWRGQKRPVTDRRDLHKLLSDVCDDVYHLAPLIRNELVNRGKLSTSAVIAIKKIIGELLSAQGEPGLGFSGNGPEVSILRGVLEVHGLYREDDEGLCSLSQPDQDTHQGIKATWDVIERFLESTNEEGLALDGIYKVLMRPPYGTREGLVPFLIWIVLIYHRQSACLYENGTYVREWSSEIFDRFVKAPGTFTVRWLIFGSTIGKLLGELNKQLPQTGRLTQIDAGVPLTGFLYNLFHWYHSLPDYSKRTQRLSRPAIELRKVLASVVDPVDMLLTRLPLALEVEAKYTLEGRIDVEQEDARINYVQKFAEAINDITGAYSAVVNDIVSLGATRFGSRPVVAELREVFQNIEPEILSHINDTTAKAFLVRARDTEASDVQWLESIGAALSNQAPRFWMDHHYEEFQEKLSLVALALADARKRHYAMTSFNGGDSLQMRRFLVEEQGNTLLEMYVTEAELASEANGIARKLVDLLDQEFSELPSQPKQLALLRALELLTDDEGDKRG